MQWSISLRGDLAKLDPEALNEMLEHLAAEHERISGMPASILNPFPAASCRRRQSRGPFRALVFYKLLSLLRQEPYWTSIGRLYIIECEMRDILDEYRRRIGGAA